MKSDRDIHVDNSKNCPIFPRKSICVTDGHMKNDMAGIYTLV